MAQIAKERKRYLNEIYEEIFDSDRKKVLDREIERLNYFGTELYVRTFYREFALDLDKQQLANMSSLLLTYGSLQDNLDFLSRMIEPKQCADGKLIIKNFDAVKPHIVKISKSGNVMAITQLQSMPYSNISSNFDTGFEASLLASLKFGYGLPYLNYISRYSQKDGLVKTLCDKAASIIKNSTAISDKKKEILLTQINNLIEIRDDLQEMRGKMPEKTVKARAQKYQDFIDHYEDYLPENEN